VLGFILDAADSDWAHPAYSEVCANLGLVLLGTRAAVGAAQKHPARTLETGR
jgi:hypothetical protein